MSTEKTNTPSLHHLIANTIRGLAMDAVQKAESGHPGMPMGMADVAVVLWTQFLKYNPADPHWPDRDRFVLSAGHGSLLLYSLLYLTGYDVSLDDIKQFRQWGSITPGHPENHLTPGVETTTGPLGQGLTNAVGMALAARWLASRFNRPGHEIVNHHTYAIVSDGDLMEGVSHEAFALAGHLDLGKLIVFYDDNHITIDGPTELSYSDDVSQRFAAYGWHTQRINGHDLSAIAPAIRAAQAETERPSLISCRTHIGYGSPNKQDTAAAHGEPLGEEEVRLTKERLGWPVDEKFYVPEEALAAMRQAGAAGAEKQAAWETALKQYEAAHPAPAAEFRQFLAGELPQGWQDHLPTFEPGKSLATRAASGTVLTGLFNHIPNLVGGSADLTGSNKTLPKGVGHLTRDDFSGRYIHFGIREHGMGGILSGMALHGGLRPYGGTFLVFSDYMRPAIRLASLMELPVIYVFTHDSIGLGEDGPTHQPIEHLMSLRAIPHLTLFRPAEATETAVGWRVALENRRGPTALVLTRQNLPTFDRSRYAPAGEAAKGAYVLSDALNPAVILIGTGSEVHIALEAQELLAEKGVAARVVSMPSWELFEAQPAAYRQSVFPEHIRARVSIEAGTPLGWERYTGRDGAIIGLDRFGASAPYEEIYRQLGLTAGAMVDAALRLVNKGI
ncbi:MAG: transketolase [Chloroflexi bacterium]|nr:transketolase [Chloroflexota bacterium]MCI0579977.1 transketolase [Chloroflexota bacterium]MCI0647491.1 transketolase [Chloroflexota bacterium]MCI0728718.1 transketolase [Chloroflexota bacterium]